MINDLNQAISPAYVAEFSSGKLGTNELTGGSAWFNKYPIGETGWHVLSVMNVEIGKKHLFESDDDVQVIYKSDLINWIINAVALGLMIYTWIAIAKRQLSVAQLLRHAFFTSLLLLLGIMAIWINEYYSPYPVQNNSLILSNRAIVEQFQNDYSVTSCLLYTSPSPRDRTRSRMPSSA